MAAPPKSAPGGSEQLDTGRDQATGRLATASGALKPPIGRCLRPSRKDHESACPELEATTLRIRKDHEAVWPEMQRALVECGWHNYSLFYRPDGLAVGYFETDADFATACEQPGESAL